MWHFKLKEILHPIITSSCADLAHRILVVTCMHGQQVIDAHSSKVIAYLRRYLVRKKGNHFIVNIDLPFVFKHSNRCRCKTFAQRIEGVDVFFLKRLPPPFEDSLAVAVDHYTMKFQATFINGVKEVDETLR